MIIPGAGGLIGSQAARRFHDLGFDVWGIDNDLRAKFFGDEASTRWMQEDLQRTLPRYQHHDVDIRDEAAMNEIFRAGGTAIAGVIHAAAQPSHDWAARDPVMDFTVNANGTLVLLEATRRHSPEAAFVFTSTNKVYGDTPNNLPLI
jgi:CDP-paratose 2-epimerase